MSGCPFASRRGFLAGAGALAGAMGAAAAAPAPMERAETRGTTEPFWGEHQGGIVTPMHGHTYFAAFDVIAGKAADVASLLRAWTAAAARMAEGRTAAELGDDLNVPAADSGEALGLSAARLTVTFGFGPGLFAKDGHDRFGLAGRRPEALVDLPAFAGDQLVEARTGGDLSVQACADDPQVAFHAVRQLASLAYGVAGMRWAQAGFSPGFAPGQTPRNLMGFRDGTQTPARPDPRALDDAVWAGPEAPDWMRGGSYLVARRIRISLEHWDRTDVDFQEQVIGRRKRSGAPLGSEAGGEFDPLDLDAADKDGNPAIPEDAHVRLAAAATNGGAQILRRAFSYNDGLTLTAERWPPWRQGMLYDAGLLFLAYQRDPRVGFIRIFENMAKLDALNQYTTHVGGGLFAIPGGARPGGFVGEGLFA